MTDFGQPPGGGGFGAPPGGPPPGGGFGAPPGGGGFGAPPGGFGTPANGGEGPPQTETLAIVSVVTGAIGLFSCCCCLALPLPVAAIITGGLGLSKINQEPGRLKGKELAYIGIGLGILAVLVTLANVLINMVSGHGTMQPAWRQFK